MGDLFFERRRATRNRFTMTLGGANGTKPLLIFLGVMVASLAWGCSNNDLVAVSNLAGSTLRSHHGT